MKKNLSKLFILFIAMLAINSCKKEDSPLSNSNTSTTGKASFWTASDLGVGNISVYIQGTFAGTISHYNVSGITCGSADVNIEKAAGTYSWSAVGDNGTQWSGTVTIVNGDCQKLQLTSGGGSGGGGGGSTTGQGMFWIASDLGVGTITVNCNGVARTITSFYSNGSPSCGSSGCASFTFSPGTYSYSASSSSSTWSGTITITAGGCTKIQLTGSSGGGGGSTTGQGMFWIASNLGTITVNCNGSSQTISSYYGSSPSCGSSGCANFTFSPGTYSYSASSSSSTWSGTITVTAGGCSKIQLTGSGGGGSTVGQAMFWTASDLGVGTITVNCNGVARTITSYYSSGSPSCGSSGCATYNLNPGSYSYTASANNGTHWSGTITVSANGCSKIQFTK